MGLRFSCRCPARPYPESVGNLSPVRIVAFLFDVTRSDLPLRVAWPLLLLNAIDTFVQEDAGYLSSYRTGDTWRVPVAAGARTATVIDPLGRERAAPVVEGRAVTTGARAGFYRVRTEAGEDVFAANLGPSEEGRIEPAATLDVGGRPAGEARPGRVGVRASLWIYLVAAALAILLVEWLTYHRRWTV